MCVGGGGGGGGGGVGSCPKKEEGEPCNFSPFFTKGGRDEGIFGLWLWKEFLKIGMTSF